MPILFLTDAREREKCDKKSATDLRKERRRERGSARERERGARLQRTPRQGRRATRPDLSRIRTHARVYV